MASASCGNSMARTELARINCELKQLCGQLAAHRERRAALLSHPERPDQRIRASGLKTGKAQVKGRILFRSGTRTDSVILVPQLRGLAASWIG